MHRNTLGHWQAASSFTHTACFSNDFRLAHWISISMPYPWAQGTIFQMNKSECLDMNSDRRGCSVDLIVEDVFQRTELPGRGQFYKCCRDVHVILATLNVEALNDPNCDLVSDAMVAKSPCFEELHEAVNANENSRILFSIFLLKFGCCHSMNGSQLPKHPLPLNAKQLPGEAPDRLIQKYGSKIVKAS
ncbi:RNA exonuclease [Trichinella pseudospiralis]